MRYDPASWNAAIEAAQDAAHDAIHDAIERMDLCAFVQGHVDESLRALKLPDDGSVVVVPREPTEKMLSELFRGYTTREQAYRAMLAAAKEG